MASIARYAKARAKPGKGDELAAELLEVANGLREVAGCELYVINRDSSDPDVVWVTELWRSEEHMQEALQAPGARERIRTVLELVAQGGFERIDLEPRGGVGYLAEETGFRLVNLEDVEDAAAQSGFGDIGEARFARGDLAALGTGLTLQRLRPGVRQAFGHRHHQDEEIYVVVSGSGRIAVDDEVNDIRRFDAIRVAPRSTRAFEAGPEGLELLAFGLHHAGDAEIQPGFWPRE
jgi:quinol monooxygenase YgiN/mannose-6-phosphate isomerase-like protein (cupin superfamily)